MIICKNCGVELEPDMLICPLCELPVHEKSGLKEISGEYTYRFKDIRVMSQPQRKATWELVSVILVLNIMITSLLNFIINKKISWAEYPVAVCLVLFSYISVFAFLNKKREIQIIYVFFLASVFILLLDLITGGLLWALPLGIPILFSVNLLLIGIFQIFRHTKKRGINLIAYIFLATAFLCAGIEIFTDLYILNRINLVWSPIVAGCVFPISTVLLFIHFRLKKGTDLKKTFHI